MEIETNYLKGRKPEELMKILKEMGVKIVVDIRDSPAYPIYYRPKSFGETCKQNGLEYRYEKALGNPKWNREQNKNDPEEQRRVYLELLTSEKERSEAVKNLKNRLEKDARLTCLICMCDATDFLGCHRFWLKEYVKELLKK